MKRSLVISFGTIATLFAATAFCNTPVLAQLQKASESVVQTIQRQPQVQLQLAAQKKVIVADEQGQPQIAWQELNGQQVQVQPGDELRYTLNGENTSDRPVKNLEVTQPIPQSMIYVLNSATVGALQGAEITYSIDSGKSFVKTPMIDVKKADGTVEKQSAPAAAYTHVRWNFGQSVAPEVALDAAYQVKVR
jgi:uncharacterized repeat protein (TIGR01451 family)